MTIPTIACDYCSKQFKPYRKGARFCSRICTNQWQRENADKRERYCPCGALIPTRTPDGRAAYHYKKYCSEACVKQLAPKRQKDPEKYRTFNCETCGKEVVRRKKAIGHRFCSNPCAAKANHALQYIVDLESSTVLDSGWEALFWGLCKFLKVEVERVDRTTAVEYEPGHWYAPDFKIHGSYVEVKGLEDSDDPLRWSRWAQERVGDGRARLVVLNQYSLNQLRRVGDRNLFMLELGIKET